MTKILFEDSIPRGHEYFSDFGDVSSYPVGELTDDDLENVSVLLTRSTTQVNPSVLRLPSSVKFVTTATAGINHLDTAWLDKAGILWSSAAGCNARAVAEWVISALLVTDADARLDMANATVGIVGAGNVGSMLASLLDALQIRYKLCDPPLQKAGDKRPFVDLDEILNCDVVSLHVPYSKEGEDATDKLIGTQELNQLNDKQILINACRGEVIDEKALKHRMQALTPPLLILDVFDNEPNIDLSLLSLCYLATPHIAGHSVEGKLRGTQIVYEQVCKLLNKPVTKQLTDFLAPLEPIEFPSLGVDSVELSLDEWRQLLLPIYDIREDDKHFRQSMAQSNQFAALRKGYRVRREISSYTLRCSGKLNQAVRSQLEAIGFNLATS